jgi:CBS domain-containing protein
MITPGEAEVGRRMTADPPAVPPDFPLREIVGELVARRTTAVVVDRRHRPLGTLSPADVLAAVTADRGRRSAARPVRSS